MFDIELLILGGLEATFNDINFLASILCILSFVYYLLGWFLGESKRKIKNGFRYRSLIHSIISSILIFLLSVTVVLILKKIDYIEIFNETVRLFIIVCGTLLPFINFVVFLFKIRSKVTDLKEELNKDIKVLETNRDTLNNDVNQLLSVNAVEASLRVD